MTNDERFDDISRDLKAYEKNGATHCEPIYLMRNRKGDVHSENTDSATVTYVKFKTQYYALTCAHVADAREGGVINGPLLIPTVWGPRGKGFAFRAGSENSLAGEFRCVKRPLHHDRELDIAIAPLNPDFIRLHMQEKKKEPIDLDKWEEPNWELIRTCANFGFPNRKKTSSGLTVSAKLLTVILELQSKPMSFERDEFFLASHIPSAEDGSSLSGHSGSLLYCLIKGGGLIPIGVLYEGSPGDPSCEKADGSFYGPFDFQIHALVLSPAKFEYWLENLNPTPAA